MIVYITRTVIISTLFISSIYSPSFAQNLQKDLFKEFSWMREKVNRLDNEKMWKYYALGKEYSIEIKYQRINTPFGSKKGFIKTSTIGHKKEPQISNVSSFPQPNKVFYTFDQLDSFTFFSTRYIVPSGDSLMYEITMSTYNTRDSVMETRFINQTIESGINDSLFLAPGRNMIDFGNRIIKIETGFKWLGPNNIYCPENGQMNWSTHPTFEKATKARDFQVIQNANRKAAEVIKRENVSINFEGSTIQALRITYKSKMPKIFWGEGSKILLVYYVVARVRSQFITCVMSHYEDQLINGVLPPPLNIVMSL